jgi:predicted ATPase/class 3 adenylate cyclase
MHEMDGLSTSERNPLPGTMLAFLFTDIEGSTRRWEAAPQAMRTALARHDQLLRAAIAQAGGQVFKTVGDASALVAALTAQRALQADGFPETGGLKVRMAVHSGVAEARDSDYFGPALNRVARLLAAAYGGQVLVSGLAVDHAQGSLPPEASLRDLGRYRLKDISEPEHIYQLQARDLLPEFPALRVGLAQPNNLPQQVTSFIGREAERADIKALLEELRLVTLVGSGGVGKTRMALQVGGDLLEHYPDGVWLIELAPLSDPQLVAETIAHLFGVSTGTGNSPTETLVVFLKDKRTLLILDNCEHLVAPVAQLADATLRGCPQVSILATSRERLAVTGEHTYSMPCLSVPDQPHGITADEALSFSAVCLFVERASASMPGFSLTDENAPAVATICKRLDGVALAIEMAAPRLKILKPQELASRLDDRFRLLTGGSRTALPRQQTLRALIDWSYDLLTDPEQTLLRRLSVFAGGWSLSGAAAVAGGNLVEEWEVLDLMALLVDKSLVVADASGAETRYRLLETTRQYAFEKLRESGERGRRRRLAEYLIKLYAEAEETWPTTPTETWVQTYAPELDNLRTSLELAFGPEGDVGLGLELTGRSLRLMQELSLFPELRRWSDAALARVDEAPHAVEAQLWLGKAYTFNQFNDPQQAGPALRAAALFENVGNGRMQAAALARAGASLMTNGKASESQPLLQQANDLLHPFGPSKHLAACLHYTGVCSFFAGHSAEAQRVITQAAAMARALGDRSGLRIILNSLAEVQFGTGAADKAVATIQQVLTDARVSNDRRTIAHAGSNLAAYCLALGDLAGARSAARDSLREARSLGLPLYLVNAVEHLAVVGVQTGQVERAARLLGYCDAWYRAKGITRQGKEKAGCDRLNALLAVALPEAVREQLLAEGAGWGETQAAEEALEVQMPDPVGVAVRSA